MAYEKFAHYYDLLMADMPYPQWLRFARQCWERFGLSPKTIVDLGCGTGSLAIPLAQDGLRVFGIDLSDDMLSVARSKEDELRRDMPFGAGGSVTWFQQDMREWELPERVDSVVCFCDSLNYVLEDDEIVQVFRQVKQGLIPGGLFLFDVHTVRTLKEYAESQPFVRNEEDIAYIWLCDLDEERSEIEHELTFFYRLENGHYERTVEHHVQRAYELEWIRGQLEKLEFEVSQYADFSFEPVSASTQRAFVVARNKG